MSTAKPRKKFRGNQMMIAKVMDCVDQAGAAAAQHERDKFKSNIGRLGHERHAAAQEKRARRAERNARLAARNQS